MNKFIAMDAEYIIKQDKDSKRLIIGVTSKIMNASCWLRINDDYLSRATCKSLITDLQAMESEMVFKKEKNDLIKNPIHD